jgi:hypothetical protein
MAGSVLVDILLLYMDVAEAGHSHVANWIGKLYRSRALWTIAAEQHGLER